MVVVYPDVGKYYLTENLSDDCLKNPGLRLASNRADAQGRRFCAKKYTDPRQAALAAALYCDLGQGVELFEYKELNGVNLYKMQRYAALIYPRTISKETEVFLDESKLQYRSLDVAGHFMLTLFSQADSAKLAETRRFMQFLMSNAGA